jgi:5-methylcytosine-specific restriction endonuclease McrA
MPSSRLKSGQCLCCGRFAALTFHHLIPKKLHRRAFYRKNFDKEALNKGVNVCRLCHDGIHDLYDEMQLAKQFSTPEALLADEALQRHFAWVAKKK